MWETFTLQEKLEPLNTFAGTDATAIDEDLIRTCHLRMNYTQRAAYVDCATAFVAAQTYTKVDPESPDATNHFYFNLMNLTLDAKAHFIWVVLTGAAV